MNKKAGISLTIETIVILILAITVLGLVMALTMNMFKQANIDVEGAFDTLTKQRIET